MGGKEHVSDRFRRLLTLYRKPDGSEWGGRDLENASGGTVSRSYVGNLKKGRIENPGLSKLEAISGAMGFQPAPWFGDAEEDRALDAALPAALKDDTFRSILEEALRLRPKDRRLLLGIAPSVCRFGFSRSKNAPKPRHRVRAFAASLRSTRPGSST